MVKGMYTQLKERDAQIRANKSDAAVVLRFRQELAKFLIGQRINIATLKHTPLPEKKALAKPEQIKEAEEKEQDETPRNILATNSNEDLAKAMSRKSRKPRKDADSNNQ
jgi:hypothetical protein